MSKAAPDKQPLLPTHVNHSSSHRLSTTRVSFPSSSTSALSRDSDDPFSEPNKPAAQSGSQVGLLGAEPQQPGIPKATWEFVWSETKCYGSYILPVVFVFGILVIGISLTVVGKKQHWF